MFRQGYKGNNPRYYFYTINLVVPVKKLEPLYTVSETAKILNVSEKTVRRLIKDEVLRAIDFRREDDRRGAVRIAPADLEDFIRDHRSR